MVSQIIELGFLAPVHFPPGLAALGSQRVRSACTGTRTALGALLPPPPERTSSSHGNTGSLDGRGPSDEPTRINHRQTVSNCSHPGFDHSDVREGRGVAPRPQVRRSRRVTTAMPALSVVGDPPTDQLIGGARGRRKDGKMPAPRHRRNAPWLRSPKRGRWRPSLLKRTSERRSKEPLQRKGGI